MNTFSDMMQNSFLKDEYVMYCKIGQLLFNLNVLTTDKYFSDEQDGDDLIVADHIWKYTTGEWP